MLVIFWAKAQKSSSGDSTPQDSVFTLPVAASSCTPPLAKNWALRRENAVGSSSTSAAPFSTASRALSHLLRQAGSPRCIKLALMATTTGWPVRCVAWRSWYKCPL